MTVLVTFVVPTFFFLGLTLLDALSRISQMTLMAVICSAAVAFVANLWKTQFDEAHNSTERLELAMADVIEQRRLTRTIVNGVDVGLVALDASGAYDSTNPRHEEFMALAYPDGHRGMAGQEGFVYAADGVTLLRSADMPTSQGGARRDVPRLPDLGRGGPGRAPRPRGLVLAVLPQQRRVRRRGARLPRHHRAGGGLAHQGRVRRVGEPRAADAAHVDHRLRRRDPRRHREPARGRARLPPRRAAQCASPAPPGRRPARRRRCSRSPPCSTSSGSR